MVLLRSMSTHNVCRHTLYSTELTKCITISNKRYVSDTQANQFIYILFLFKFGFDIINISLLWSLRKKRRTQLVCAPCEMKFYEQIYV